MARPVPPGDWLQLPLLPLERHVLTFTCQRPPAAPSDCGASLFPNKPTFLETDLTVGLRSTVKCGLRISVLKM